MRATYVAHGVRIAQERFYIRRRQLVNFVARNASVMLGAEQGLGASAWFGTNLNSWLKAVVDFAQLDGTGFVPSI